MEERIYQFRYVFIETEVFKGRYGRMSDSERDRLYFDLMLGGGEPIKGLGGLKEIRCGPGGRYGQTGWEIVFADYFYPDIGHQGKRIFFLLVAFPIDISKKLSQEERETLKRLKAMADDYVESHY